MPKCPSITNSPSPCATCTGSGMTGSGPFSCARRSLKVNVKTARKKSLIIRARRPFD